MFYADCPSCGARVLLAESHILAVHNRPDGIEIAYRCTCGARGAFRTGVRRPRRP
jgi:hypothetical protein